MEYSRCGNFFKTHGFFVLFLTVFYALLFIFLFCRSQYYGSIPSDSIFPFPYPQNPNPFPHFSLHFWVLLFRPSTHFGPITRRRRKRRPAAGFGLTRAAIFFATWEWRLRAERWHIAEIAQHPAAVSYRWRYHDGYKRTVTLPIYSMIFYERHQRTSHISAIWWTRNLIMSLYDR